MICDALAAWLAISALIRAAVLLLLASAVCILGAAD